MSGGRRNSSKLWGKGNAEEGESGGKIRGRVGRQFSFGGVLNTIKAALLLRLPEAHAVGSTGASLCAATACVTTWELQLPCFYERSGQAIRSGNGHLQPRPPVGMCLHLVCPLLRHIHIPPPPPHLDHGPPSEGKVWPSELKGGWTL